MSFHATYCIALIFNLRRARWDFASKTANIVAEVLVIVNGVYYLAKTTRVVHSLLSLDRANVQAIAQQKLLIERC